MQWVSGFRDFFYPFAAFWEWAPMTADVIAAIILCIVYLKWLPGRARIKNCPRPFIIVPILTVVFVVMPTYGFHQFMVFLKNVPMSCDCDSVMSLIDMPADRVINWAQLRAEKGGGGFGKFSTPAKEIQLTYPLGALWRCRVVNHGSDPLFNVDMALHLTFAEAIHDDKNPGQTNTGAITLVLEWPIPIPMIDAGPSGFVLYISNISPQYVFVTLPESVTFQHTNSDTRSTTQLMQPPGLRLTLLPVS